jgi:hypothetical protein
MRNARRRAGSDVGDHMKGVVDGAPGRVLAMEQADQPSMSHNGCPAMAAERLVFS